MDERGARAEAMLDRIFTPAWRSWQGGVPWPSEAGKDFARLCVEHCYADAWSREGSLDLKTRSLLTLTVLEVVLGIDNIIFISILAGKLPKEQQAKARTIGLGLAMITRIGLLFSLSFILQLTEPLFTIGQDISGRDLILILGGLFLIAKSTHEIHNKLEGDPGEQSRKVSASYGSVLIQIVVSPSNVRTASPLGAIESGTQ